MPKQKLPWRTLVTQDGPSGRFTREQIRNAVMEVMEMRAAQAERARKRGARDHGQTMVRPRSARDTSEASS